LVLHWRDDARLRLRSTEVVADPDEFKTGDPRPADSGQRQGRPANSNHGIALALLARKTEARADLQRAEALREFETAARLSDHHAQLLLVGARLMVRPGHEKLVRESPARG
jgi:hypothetical protein